MKLTAIRNIILLSFFWSFSFAQHLETIRFSRVSIKDGLSQSTVNCLIQDRQGYIWIGTQDGLNRFDGYEFKVFKQKLHKGSGLTDAFINCLHQDFDGNIWIGTQTGGINVYDPVRRTFKHIDNIDGFSNTEISAIVPGINHTLWISSLRHGIVHYNPKDGSYKKYSVLNGLNSNKITCLEMIGDQLWIGTESNGLCILDTQTSKVENFLKGWEETKIHENGITDIKIHSPGKVLVSTTSSLYLATWRSNGLIFIPVKKRTGANFDFFEGIAEVSVFSEKEIWLATQEEGLYKLSVFGKDTLVQNFKHSDFDQNSLSNKITNTIFKDKAGVVWVGTQDALCYFDPVKQGFNHIKYEYDNPASLNDKNIWAVQGQGNDILWVGTRKGVTRINTRQQEFNHFTYTSDNPSQPNNHSIYDIEIDSSGRIWVAASGGLYELETNEDFSQGTFRKVRYPASLASLEFDRIFDLELDNNNKLWIGLREGIAIMDLGTGDIDKVVATGINGESIPNDECRVIHFDNDGDIWLGIQGAGLIQLILDGDSTSYKMFQFKADPSNKNSISDNTILTILEQEESVFWIGTYGGGINRFNKEKHSFENFTELDGLPNNTTYGILQGDEESIWISTNYGLSNFNTTDFSFQNYTENDGLQSNEFNTGAFYRSDDGRLYFGGINGLNSFYPDDIQRNEYVPDVVITEVSLYNKPLTDIVDTLPDISFLNSITLNYKENNLTFKFSALHFTHAKGMSIECF